jgi:hypothetical protein
MQMQLAWRNETYIAREEERVEKLQIVKTCKSNRGSRSREKQKAIRLSPFEVGFCARIIWFSIW